MIEVAKIWFDEDAVWIETSDGKTACELFEDYPRLRNATKEQRENIEHDCFGIHWPDLDEDLSFEGFFRDKKKEQSFLYKIFMQHPEINVSAVARRLGIKQSLLAAYISGQKTPSYLRLMEIVSCLNQIGKELVKIELPEEQSTRVADENNL